MKREHQCFESRFQRSAIPRSQSWSDAPGYDEGALSALKANARCGLRNRLSAKGAALNVFESRFQRSPVSGFEPWGDAPGYDEGALSALKANARSGRQDMLSAKESWGDAPGDDEEALSALTANAEPIGHDVLSANGAPFTDSLGQRPRSLIQSKSTALKARFTLGVCR